MFFCKKCLCNLWLLAQVLSWSSHNLTAVGSLNNLQKMITASLKLLIVVLSYEGQLYFRFSSAKSMFNSYTIRADMSLTICIQVLERLSELETTLDAGLRHRDKALTSINFHLAKWMNMVRWWLFGFLLSWSIIPANFAWPEKLIFFMKCLSRLEGKKLFMTHWICSILMLQRNVLLGRAGVQYLQNPRYIAHF